MQNHGVAVKRRIIKILGYLSVSLCLFAVVAWFLKPRVDELLLNEYLVRRNIRALHLFSVLSGDDNYNDRIYAFFSSGRMNSADRASFVRSIGNIGRTGPKIQKVILSSLSDTDPSVRAAAVFAASFHERLRASIYLMPLSSLLKDEEREVRLEALFAIARYGSEGKAYLPDIRRFSIENSINEEVESLSK